MIKRFPNDIIFVYSHTIIISKFMREILTFFLLTIQLWQNLMKDETTFVSWVAFMSLEYILYPTASLNSISYFRLSLIKLALMIITLQLTSNLYGVGIGYSVSFWLQASNIIKVTLKQVCGKCVFYQIYWCE